MRILLAFLIASAAWAQTGIVRVQRRTVGGGGPTWTLLDHKSCGGGSGTCTTPAIDTTAGGGATLLIAAVVTYGTPTTSTISDSAGGNTWVGPNDVASFSYECGGCAGALFFSVPSNRSATHTLTFTSGNPHARVYFLAFRNTRTMVYQGAYGAGTTYSQYDTVRDAGDAGLYQSIAGSNVGNQPSSSPSQWRKMFYTGTSTSSTVTASSAVTPVADHSLVLTLLQSNNQTTSGTVDAGSIVEANLGGGVTISAAIAWLEQDTAAAINPTWTVAGNSSDLGVITMFFY